MRLFRMLVISSGLICMSCRLLDEAALGRATCLRSCSSRLRIEASRIELPTLMTMPPRMSGSTRAASVTLRPARSPIVLPRLSVVCLVERDRARDLHRQRLVLLVPQPLVLVADAEDHGHAVVLDQQLEEVQRAPRPPRRAGAPSAVAASRSSRSTARRRTPRARGSGPARRRTAPSCSRSSSSLPCSRATSNSARAYTWASSSISCSAAPAGDAGEVQFARAPPRPGAAGRRRRASCA